MEIEIAKGVAIQIDDKNVSVKGPKGKASQDFNDPRFNDLVVIVKEGDKIKVYTDSDKKKIKAIIRTIGSQIKNMVMGTSEGFVYKLKITYIHFPMTVEVKGKEVHIKNFLGEKGARIAKIMGDAEVKIQKDEVSVTGADKKAVSQTAANIEQVCSVKKLDRRVFQDGIYITGKFLQNGEAV